MDFQDKSAYSWNKRALTLIVLGILVLVNILSLQFFLRFDWTREGQYSISDSTVSVLQELDDLVTVKAYFSADLPPQLLPIRQYVKDILSEYQAYGSGNFDFQFVDPAQDPDAIQESQRIGVQQVRMQVREGDSFQVKNGYLGIGIFFKGKSEAIPVIQEQDAANLEYDLTSLILKLTQPKLPVAAFLQGHSEHVIDEKDYSIAAKLLRKNYEVKTVDFSEQDTLDGVDVLIVAGPKRNLTDRAIFEIDQYFLRGGKAVFLIDGVSQAGGSIDVQDLDVNVKTLFTPLGVTVDSNVLLDALSELANFSEGPGRFFFLQYPAFIRLVADNFTKNAIVSKVQSFVVRFVSSLTVTEKEGLTYDRFINTSPASWAQQSPFQLSPTGLPNSTPDQQSSKAVAVQVSGKFPRISPLTNIPKLQQWKEDPATKEFKLEDSATDEHRKGREVLKEAKEEAKLIVFADSDFVSDPFVEQDQASLVVFLNMVDSMTFGEKLISIRSKSLGGSTIGQLESSEKSLMKFFGILLVPILLSGYGLIRLWMRRKEEKLLKL